MAAWPTTFWHSGDAANSTHLAATGLFSEPTQIESARPLYTLARLPLGPIGVGATPVSTSSYPNIVLIIHEPLVTIAYRPAEKMSELLCPVTAARDGI
jgi:hypothetical protein